MKHIGKIITILVITILVSVLYLYKDKILPKKEVKEVPIAIIKQEDFKIEIKSQGKSDALHFSRISSPLRGTVMELPVKEGDAVKKGDIVLKFDPIDFERTLSNRMLEYKQAENDLNKEKEQLAITEKAAQLKIEEQKASLDFYKDELKVAETQLEREERLYKENISTLSKLEDQQKKVRSKKYTLEKAISELNHTKETSSSDIIKIQQNIRFRTTRLLKSKNDYEKARYEHEKTIIKAPSDGILIYKDIRKGSGKQDKLMQGDSVNKGNELMKIVNSDSLIVFTNIKDSDILKIKLGQQAYITPDSSPNTVLQGKITKISGIASRSPVEYPAEIEITENPDKILKTGMQVMVEIVLKEIKNAITVPLECIYRDGDDIYVWLKTDKGSFVKQNITLSDRNEKVAVVLKGLKAGDKIALRDPNEKDSESKPKLPNGSKS